LIEAPPDPDVEVAFEVRAVSAARRRAARWAARIEGVIEAVERGRARGASWRKDRAASMVNEREMGDAGGDED